MIPKFSGVISHIHQVKSPQRTLGKGKENLEENWANYLSITFSYSLRFPIGATLTTAVADVVNVVANVAVVTNAGHCSSSFFFPLFLCGF